VAARYPLDPALPIESRNLQGLTDIRGGCYGEADRRGGRVPARRGCTRPVGPREEGRIGGNCAFRVGDGHATDRGARCWLEALHRGLRGTSGAGGTSSTARFGHGDALITSVGFARPRRRAGCGTGRPKPKGPNTAPLRKGLVHAAAAPALSGGPGHRRHGAPWAAPPPDFGGKPVDRAGLVRGRSNIYPGFREGGRPSRRTRGAIKAHEGRRRRRGQRDARADGRADFSRKVAARPRASSTWTPDRRSSPTRAEPDVSRRNRRLHHRAVRSSRRRNLGSIRVGSVDRRTAASSSTTPRRVRSTGDC